MHRLLVRACQDQVRRRRAFDVKAVVLDIDRTDPVDDYAGVAQRDELERAFPSSCRSSTERCWS